MRFARVILSMVGFAGVLSSGLALPRTAFAVALSSRSASSSRADTGQHRSAPGTSVGNAVSGRVSSGRASPGKGEQLNKSSSKAKALPRNGPVELFSVNNHETLVLRLRDDKGRPLKGIQKRFDQFLRCHHTNTKHAMNPRLVRVLYQVGRHYPGRRVEVVSGYRHPTVAKNPHSPHMQGLACDFRIVGVKNGDLRDYLRRDFQKVGVGYYPNSSFVHLDVRKDKSAFWIDYSGPGDRAVYSEDPSGDLRNGRADSFRPTKIDPNWVEQPDSVGTTGKSGAPAIEEGEDGESGVGGDQPPLAGASPPS